MNNDFIDIRVSNGRYILALKDINHPAYFKSYKVKITEDCIDEDWKTFIARNKPMVPKDTVFKEYKLFQNLYGLFFDVEYKGFKYSIDPRYTKLIKISD